MSDYNEILFQHEKGERRDRMNSQIEQFRNALRLNNLLDVGCNGD